MDLYTKTSYELAEILTKRFSTSFSLASRLFEGSIRPHIYAIYGMVRLADEIVDTYRAADAAERLDAFESQTMQAVETGYSTNPLLHAFALTARAYGIDKELIEPFFDSMRVDLTKQEFTKAEYDTYIYGSAEVIGLMCLRVFVVGDNERYEQLRPGAQALGAAYQKINFLRDIAADYEERGRVYFPGIDIDTMTDDNRQEIIDDIEADFAVARPTIEQLPSSAKRAVRASYSLYSELFERLKTTPMKTLRTTRVRVPATKKARSLLGAVLR